MVFEPVSGLLVDYVKVHCQKLWEKYMPRAKKNRCPQKSPSQLISRMMHGLGAVGPPQVLLQWTGRTTEEGEDAGQESRERTEGRSQLPRNQVSPTHPSCSSDIQGHLLQ